MLSDDSSGSKQIQDLQKMWQQTTTNDSLKLKENEMTRDIQKQVDTFDEKFGFAASRGVRIAGGLLVGNILYYFFQNALFGQTNFGNIAAIVLFTLLMGYQLFTKRQMRHFDMSNSHDYFKFNLIRVRRQMLVQTLFVPFAIVALLAFGFLSDKGKAISALEATIFSSIFIAGLSTFLAWEYKYKLIPLRNKLQSALQQLNEH